MSSGRAGANCVDRIDELWVVFYRGRLRQRVPVRDGGGNTSNASRNSSYSAFIRLNEMNP